MLSAIVQKVTGQTVLDYLRPRLFEPLGITNPQWEASAQGISMGGFGLSVRTEDIARFGQLYLRKGEWQKRQLVPAAWVETATARHASNGSSPTSDWEQGMGISSGGAVTAIAATARTGSSVWCCRKYDAVIAFTSGTRDMGSVMNLTWEMLAARAQAGRAAGRSGRAQEADREARVADAASADQMTGARRGRCRRPPRRRPRRPARATCSRATRSRSNPSRCEAADASGRVTLTMRVAGADRSSRRRRMRGRSRPSALRGAPDAIATSGAWSADDTYKLSIVRYQTPFTAQYTLRFAADQLTSTSNPTSAHPPTARFN